MPYRYEQWAEGTMAQREGVGKVPEKGPTLSVLVLQTPSVSQSYKHQTFSLSLHLQNKFYVVFNRGLMSY